ncbi:MAG: LacI family DNA-binding transcriptional regulator [Bacteroidota bacterium]
MKQQPVTLKDIAAKLGVSVATVSRALRGYPDIRPETKEAVLELAEEMRYRPNPLAMNLRKNQSNIIGLMIPEVVHHFFSSIIEGVMEVAEEQGYTVMICQSNEEFDRERRDVGMLLSARVDGLLISHANSTTDFAHLQEYLDLGIPIVMYDKVTDNLDVSKVVVDDYQGSFQATEHLIVQGCTRIAHIRGPQGVKNAEERLQGYKEALIKHGLPVDEELIKSTYKVDLAEGASATSELLSLPHPPDGIYAVTDLVALGVMQTLRESGIRVPDQMAVIGFSNWFVSSVVDPPLSTVHQPGTEIGKTATTMLINEIRLGQAEKAVVHETRVLNTRLVVRESSKRKRG